MIGALERETREGSGERSCAVTAIAAVTVAVVAVVAVAVQYRRC